MTVEPKEIKKSLSRLSYYENLSNSYLDAWEADPLNSDREAALDKAYNLEFQEFMHAAYLISKFAGIDEKDARSILKKGREKVLQILE